MAIYSVPAEGVKVVPVSQIRSLFPFLKNPANRHKAVGFTSGHQENYVNFRNEDRAPLLFIAGSEDNIMPPAVNQSNVKHYRHAKTVTDYKEFAGRSHYGVIGGQGWDEVADYALQCAQAKPPARKVFSEVRSIGADLLPLRLIVPYKRVEE